jgi:hypothetical protein
MAEQFSRQHSADLIGKLRERIKQLDHIHSKATDRAAYITMNKQETRNYEERAQGLSELRRELLNLVRSLK